MCIADAEVRTQGQPSPSALFWGQRASAPSYNGHVENDRQTLRRLARTISFKSSIKSTVSSLFVHLRNKNTISRTIAPPPTIPPPIHHYINTADSQCCFSIPTPALKYMFVPSCEAPCPLSLYPIGHLSYFFCSTSSVRPGTLPPHSKTHASEKHNPHSSPVMNRNARGEPRVAGDDVKGQQLLPAGVRCPHHVLRKLRSTPPSLSFLFTFAKKTPSYKQSPRHHPFPPC